MEKIYLKELESLRQEAEGIANSPMMARGKILTLVILNMRYETIMLNRRLDKHPYLLVRDLIKDALVFLKMWRETYFIENKSTPRLFRQKKGMEEEHRLLFQQLWKEFDTGAYEERIQRYIHRLRINCLGRPWLDGKSCIDFGCGHGNFAHAMIREGASRVYALDFGASSIEYAVAARNRLCIKPERIEFRVESVYKVSAEDDSFDFAVENGVFHHLEDEGRAIGEVRRVLKPGGWFWVYADGSGGISYDLWDTSLYILRDVPHEFILSTLDMLNLDAGKRYHLGDNLNAVYRHTTWAELTARLQLHGFGNFRRLKGGFVTDFDDDVIADDKYGREKFGEGDLRLLAQKLS